jgi:acetaldehyde dehydrogenase (acetylating)
MSIHSESEDVILQFGLKKPAFRICVNTPTTHGSIGLTTGLDPALTLGCGGWGGNITSDNISPRHLLNIKRLAYETRPAVVARPQATAFNVAQPASPEPSAHDGIPVETLATRIDTFLATRGFANDPTAPPGELPTHDGDTEETPEAPGAAVADFVCEEDVLAAMRSGHKLLVGEKTILTPSARDLGEAEKVFVQAPWSDASH